MRTKFSDRDETMNTRTRHALALILLAGVIAAPAGCSKIDERLIGKWEAEIKAPAGIRTVMMLEFKKNGSMRVRLGKGGPVLGMRYSAHDGTITVTERGASQSIPYSFTDERLVLSYPLLGELNFKRAH
ncbi:MAG TPA: hypothetical protein PLG31_13855 [Spirochaetota bacterium]|nr:hypothetical protein [Spirochaetota bacterium]